ncbi:MAG: Smr/MutS family protein [Acetobacteraceae bacterium]|nr:Smr/MutS family protein [Acetobacteraceae bacterium]MBV8590030.1 Smr/MutS family protein [Acetobacteraceae bacterium]
MARRPFLTEAERADWAAFARHVRALPGRVTPEFSAPPGNGRSAEAKPPPQTEGVGLRRARPAVPPLVIGAQPPGLDGGSWQRFRTGKLRAARTLDLHGRTAQRACHALEHFLHAAHADRLRCVEVITGVGRGEGTGVIRREFPIWLNLPTVRSLVLAAIHPHAGNPGAVRLLLRRAR